MPSFEEMHQRLRNYSRLQDSLRAVMEASLRHAPMYLELEARYTYVCTPIMYEQVSVIVPQVQYTMTVYKLINAITNFCWMKVSLFSFNCLDV